MVANGEWSALLVELNGVAVYGLHADHAALDLPAERSGVLTEGRLRRMNAAVQSKVVTKAWKQIWGWGTPGVNPRTGEALRSQLCGQPVAPVVPEVTFADVQTCISA